MVIKEKSTVLILNNIDDILEINFLIATRMASINDNNANKAIDIYMINGKTLNIVILVILI